MKKKLTIALAMIMLLTTMFFIAGCGNETAELPETEVATPTPTPEVTPEPTPEPTSEPTPEPTPEPEPEEPPHEHVWREANFQQPKTCLECGETEGEPLTPRFDDYGFTLTPHDTQQRYVTRPFDTNARVAGTVSATDFRIISGDGKREEKDGYEWRILTVRFVFDCDTANRHGMVWAVSNTDYYSIDLSDRFEPWEPDEFGRMTFSFNYNGNDYESVFFYEESVGRWNNRRLTVVNEFSFLVPIGYDGVVIAAFNFANVADYAHGNVADPGRFSDAYDDNTVFFRLG